MSGYDGQMSQDQEVALQGIARRAMLQYGLEPDWPPQVEAELAGLRQPDGIGLRDLRALPWSSIDNDDSRDLDQLEVCIDDGGTHLLVAIADVDALVNRDSALDAHAKTNTTSVYTPARIFAMLPPQLSTDLTSLNEGQDRVAVVVDMTIGGGDGALVGSDVYPALVRNHVKLTYNGVGAWLDGTGPIPAAMATVPGLQEQVRLQDRLAGLLRERRRQEGALDFDRTEVKPVLTDGKVAELRTEEPNRARDLIESFMVAANGVTARFLSSRNFPSLRRVVRSPDRWPRIVELAGQVRDDVACGAGRSGAGGLSAGAASRGARGVRGRLACDHQAARPR